MKKAYHRRKITAIFLGLLLAPSLSGCGGSARPVPLQKQSKVPVHRFELLTIDNPEQVSEGVFLVGWIRASYNSHVQIIPVEMDEPDVNWTQWGLKKQDVNFDGYADISVCQHGGAKWGRFHWYLYNPEKMEFYTNALTKELSALTCADFKTDPQTKKITITRFLGADLTEYSYQIVDGHLRLSQSQLLRE